MRNLLFVLGFVIALGPELFAQRRTAAVPVATAATGFATVRSGDTIDMRLSGMPADVAAEFNISYTVGQDGTINVPLIGEIRASGLTPNQLERTIQSKLVSEKLFTRPTVIINVGGGVRFVSISGEVKAPNRLPWTPDSTLYSAIGNCGGLGEFTSGKNIRIIRQEKVFGVYNWKDIQKDPSKDVKLLPGDQVVVPASGGFLGFGS